MNIFTYRTKLLLSISAISIIMLVALAINRITSVREILYEKSLVRIETSGRLLADGILDNLRYNETADLKKTIDLAARESDIKFISVVNNLNVLIYSSDKSLEFKSNPYTDSPDIMHEEKGTYITSFPMEYKGRKFGYVQIGFLMETIHHVIKKAIFITVVLNLMSLFLILLISYYISGKLTEPLVNMKQFSDKIAKGDFSTKLNIRSKDIIGQLSNSLNHMSGELEALTNNLNEKVQEAISNLALANEELQEKTFALEKSNKKLLELDKLKSDFVSIVSH